MNAEWLAALRDGVSAEELEERIRGAPSHEAVSGVRALGAEGGSAATSLLARLAQDAEGDLALAAIEALGNVPAAEAAAALDEIARSAPDKALQKAARRSLHRLGSRGIRPQQTTRAAVPLVERTATLYRAVASAFDGRGERTIWFAAERPLGGIYQVAVLIDDVLGLVDCNARDTTRKRFAEQEQKLRESDPTAWVELPLDYARQLVQEAADRAREARRPIPPGYAVWADLIDRPEEPFKEALVYRELSAFEARVHPTLERETPLLFEEPEVEPWFFEPDRVQKWVAQLRESPTSRLLITPESEEDRAERLLREAARELLPPDALHGLRRRLEETAYIFLRTDREQSARRAVAAAVGVEEARPLQPLHPFARAMMTRSFRIAMSVERTGFEPARLERAR